MTSIEDGMVLMVWNGIDGVLFFDLVAGDGIWLLHCKVIQLSFFCDFLLTFLL